MARAEELDLPSDAPKEVLDTQDLPEQFGKALPALYPGTYKFRTPANMASAWVSTEITIYDAQGNPVMVEVTDDKGEVKKIFKKEPRVSLQFDEDHPLEVVDCVDKEQIGKSFYGRISNAERNRARRNEPRKAVPDMLYFLQAMGFQGKIANGANKEYIAAVNKYAGHNFVADVEWSAYSSVTRARFIYAIVNGAHDMDTTIEDPNGKVGDGKKWYMKNIPKDPATGRWQETFARGTGEQDLSGLEILEAIRCFPGLARFRGAAK